MNIQKIKLRVLVVLLLGTLQPFLSAMAEPYLEGKYESEWIALLKTGSVEERRQSVLALGLKPRSMSSTAIDALIGALSDPDEQVRLGAVHSLWKVKSRAKDAVPRLIALLDDSSPEIQSRILLTLRSIGPDAKAALPLIDPFLNHAEPEMRYLALQTIAAIGVRTEHLEALTGMFSEENWRVREEAALAISQLGPDGKAALPALWKLANDPKARVRLRALQSIWRVNRDEKVIPLITDLLIEGAPHPFHRKDAAFVLQEIGKPAVSELIRALRSDGSRYLAVQSLGEIGPDAKSAIIPLRQLFTNPETLRGAEVPVERYRYEIELALRRIQEE